MIPAPPRNLEMPQTAELLFLGMSAALVVVLIVVGIGELRKRRDPALLLLLVAGGIACFFEPIVDVNGHMYLRERGAIQAYTLYDRAMPIFAVVAYAGYFAALAHAAMRAFAAGITTSQLFKLFGVMAVFNIAFETPAVLLNVYDYYGDQPFDFWGFPLWWGIVNPLSSLIAATVIILARRHIVGWRDWMILPLVFVAAGCANGAAAGPIWLALNSGASDVVKHLAALATLGIALAVVRFIAALMCTDAQPSDEIRPQGHHTEGGREWQATST